MLLTPALSSRRGSKLSKLFRARSLIGVYQFKSVSSAFYFLTPNIYDQATTSALGLNK
jgi:hypothetical protein